MEDGRDGGTLAPDLRKIQSLVQTTCLDRVFTQSPQADNKTCA